LIITVVVPGAAADVVVVVVVDTLVDTVKVVCGCNFVLTSSRDTSMRAGVGCDDVDG